MWGWLKVIPQIISGIKKIFSIFKKISRSWSKWRDNKALKKAKNKFNTEDLQKRVSKKL